MEKKKILFLGNSHTYFNDMPELFRRICMETGFCDADISMLAYPCATYETHLQQKTSLRHAMLYGNYDVLIMQQAAHSPCPSRAETLRDGSKIIRHARKNNILPLQILPWAEERFPEHQAEINSIYKELSEREPVTLIPAGTIFERARNRRDIPNLYWTDGEHASPWGSYAVACAVYAVLSGNSSAVLKNESLSYQYVGNDREQGDWKPSPFSLETDACRRLQDLVWECVFSAV